MPRQHTDPGWRRGALLPVGITLVLTLLAPVGSAGETVTYEGFLTQWGHALSSDLDFRVRLYDRPQELGSRELADEQELLGVPVEDGVFTIALEVPPEAGLGAVWLEVDARLPGEGEYVTLEHRQRVDVVASRASTPPGAVVFFDLANCPEGWSPFTPAYGRAIVGLNPFGTLGAQVGVALSDQEAPSHRHVFSGGLRTRLAGEHYHRWARTDNVGGQRWISYNQSGAEVIVTAWGNGIGNEGSGHYPLSKNNNSSSEYVTEPSGEHTHELGSGATGFEYGDLPYVQLLACAKE